MERKGYERIDKDEIIQIMVKMCGRVKRKKTGKKIVIKKMGEILCPRKKKKHEE